MSTALKTQDAPTQDQTDRRSGLGGSDIAQILGLSRNGGPWAVWAEKRGVETGKTFGDTPESRWGIVAEDALAAFYTGETGIALSPGEYVQHPEHAIVHGHTDRMIGDDGVWEGKTAAYPGAWDDWGEEDTDEIPPDHLVQCQWYLFASGRSYCVVVALVNGRIRTYRVEALPSLQVELLRVARAFWDDYVVTGIAPPEDGSDAAMAVLRALAATRADITVVANSRQIEMARAYEAARVAKADAVLEHDRWKQIVIRDLIDAGATCLRGDGWRITYRQRFTPTLKALRAVRLDREPDEEQPLTEAERSLAFAIADFSPSP